MGLMASEESIEVKFRLADGSDIGSSKYSPTVTVGTLKEMILSQLPKEKAAEEAKEEAAKSGLDIFAKVDELKQAQQLAKETNDMDHDKEVYAKNASVGNELKELEGRASDVVNEGGRFMQRALEMRLTAAISGKELADKEKMEKESLAKEALAFEESQMSKLVEESMKLKEAAVNNSKGGLDYAGGCSP